MHSGFLIPGCFSWSRKEVRAPDTFPPPISWRFAHDFPVSTSAVPRATARSRFTLAFARSPACASLGPLRARAALGVIRERRARRRRPVCTQSADPDWPDEFLGEAVLEVDIRNGAAAPLTVHRDEFRLVTPDGALPPRSWGAAEPLGGGGNETSAFTLRFQAYDSLACERELWLDPRAGLVVWRTPAAIGPVRFVPWRPRTAGGATSSQTPSAARASRLTHRDLGPRARDLRPEVPNEELSSQDPVTAVDDKSIDANDHRLDRGDSFGFLTIWEVVLPIRYVPPFDLRHRLGEPRFQFTTRRRGRTLRSRCVVVNRGELP